MKNVFKFVLATFTVAMLSTSCGGGKTESTETADTAAAATEMPAEAEAPAEAPADTAAADTAHADHAAEAAH